MSASCFNLIGGDNISKTVRYFNMFFILISPLFSALLTDDLQVIVPTGVPLIEKRCISPLNCYNPDLRITSQVMEAPIGMLLIRAQSKTWIACKLTTGKNLSNTHRITVCCPSSGTGAAEKPLNVNVVLE